MGGNVDEESAPPELGHPVVTSEADRSLWPPCVLKPLLVTAFSKANSILYEKHAAEDIAQGIVAALVAGSDVPPNPAAWVTQGAEWAALKELRRCRREEEKLSRLAHRTVAHSEDFTDRVAARFLLDQILAPLTPRQRRALELEFLLGYPPATVAKALGITKDALKKLRGRALAKARSEYERLAAEGGDQ